AHAKQKIELLFCHEPATLAMQRLARRSEFQHLARHRDVALARHERERFRRCYQCLRTGIVAIVDDCNVAEVENLPPLVGGLEAGQRFGNLCRRDASRHGDRCRRQHVMDVMSAQQGAGNRLANAICHQIKAGASSSEQLDVLRAYIGIRRESEKDALALEVAAKLRTVFVVSIQEGGAARSERRNQFEFCTRDAGDGIKILQMNRGYRRNYSVVRMCNSRQGGYLTRMRHPHFDDGDLVFWLQLQQSKRQSKMIVEVAFR